MNNTERPPKFFFLNLKKQVSKHGTTFYTGKMAYAIDLVAFEKKDGSGDLTVWMQPKDMDQMNQRKQQQQAPLPPEQRPQPPPPAPRYNYPRHPSPIPPAPLPPPQNNQQYPEDDDIPF